MWKRDLFLNRFHKHFCYWSDKHIVPPQTSVIHKVSKKSCFQMKNYTSHNLEDRSTNQINSCYHGNWNHDKTPSEAASFKGFFQRPRWQRLSHFEGSFKCGLEMHPSLPRPWRIQLMFTCQLRIYNPCWVWQLKFSSKHILSLITFTRYIYIYIYIYSITISYRLKST